MAQSPAGPGIYSPWNLRSRRLISQLRAATHRTVQNAIIQELIHELEKGSRRARKRTRWLRRQAAQWGRKVAQAGRAKAGNAARRAWYGPQMQCCGQTFHNRLQFGAHAISHRQPGRAADRGPVIRSGYSLAHSPQARPQKGRGKKATVTPRAHARNTLAAAGPAGRAAQAAARNPAASGRPLGAKELKDMAKGTRTSVPQAATRARAPRAAAARQAEHSYPTPAGPMTSDRPRGDQQIKDLMKEVQHARDLQAAGRARPGDTVKTTRLNGQRTSSRVVPGRTPPSAPGSAQPRTPSPKTPTPRTATRPGRS